MKKHLRKSLVNLILILIVTNLLLYVGVFRKSSVIGATYVAKIGSRQFETLEDAVNAASTGDTVTVIRNTEFAMSIRKSITLDLGGYTISGRSTANWSIGINANVTVKNGTVNVGDNITGIWIEDSGVKATLINVNVKSTNRAAIVCRGESCDIQGGTIYSASECGVYNAKGSTLTISSGTISTGSYRALENRGTCEISGGTIKCNSGTAIYVGYDDSCAKLSITGGSVIANGGGNAIYSQATPEFIDRNISIASKVSVSGKIVNLYCLLYFDPNGGTYSGYNGTFNYSTPQSVIWGEKMTSLPTATKSHYTFNGWYNGTTKLTTSMIHKSNSSYTASWTPEVYAVTLDNQSATTVGTTTIYEKYGEGYFTNSTATYQMTSSANGITIPKKTGYTFAGYFTQTGGNGTKYIDANGKITSSASSTKFEDSTGKLYAYWTINTYSISYSYDNGIAGSNAPTSATYNKDVIIDNPTRTGYTFAGWKTSTSNGLGSAAKTGTSSNPSVSWNGSATTNRYFKNLRDTSGTVTLTATWTKNTYTISYNLVNGTNASGNPTSGSTDTTLTISAPSRTGYTFTGWTTSSSAGLGTNAKTGTSSSPSTTWTGSLTTNKYFKNLRDTSGTVTLTANWSENTYTIAFNSNGGTGSMSSLTGVKYTENKILTMNSFTKSGYAFKGWATSSTGSVAYDNGANVSKLSSSNGATVTLYAIWEKETYTITYNLNGGINSSSNPSTYQVDSYAINIQPPTKDGYTFTGWTGSNGGTPQTSVTIPKGSTGNKTYTANWASKEYTIAYNLDGGALESGKTNPTNGAVNVDVNIANEPVKTGYTFAGWTSNSTAGLGSGATTGTSANPTTTWSGSLTKNKYFKNLRNTTGTVYMTANWTENTYSIAFNNNGGTGSMNSISGIKYTDFEYLPSNTFTKLGYTFKGWAETDTGAKKYDNGQAVNKLTATNGATITLYAVWEKETYTITYTLNGGTNNSSNPNSYKVDTATINLQPPTKTGYTFTGWTGSNGTNSETSVSIPVGSTGNKTYVAHWTVNSYTIEYNLNNGSLAQGKTNPTSGTYDSDVNIANEPIKEGYTFTGWSTNTAAGLGANAKTGISSNPTTSWNGNLTKNTYYRNLRDTSGTVTLTANWSENTYTIAFNSNGGTGTMTSLSGVKYTESKTLTSNTFTRDGYTFKGWALESTGTKKYDNGATVTKLSATNNATVTLFAVWEKITYTITYNLDGGTNNSLNPSTYQVDTETINLQEPTKIGYAFTGWTGSNGNTPEISVPIPKGTTGNKTYTAHWISNGYGIAYNLDGGELETGKTNPASGKVNEDINIANEPIKQGFTFTGWTSSLASGLEANAKTGTSSNPTTTWNGSLTKNKYFKDLRNNEGTVTLTANWSENTYNIAFNNNSGTGSMSSMTAIRYTETKTLPSNTFTRLGYDFKGWAASATGTKLYDDGANVSRLSSVNDETVTLYAVWEKQTYVITYNLDGGINHQLNPSSYQVDTATINLQSPKRTGYTFTGWTGSNGTIAQTSVNILSGSTGDKTYIAHWTKDTYTITYNLNGGTLQYSNPSTYNVEDRITLNEPEKLGYTFIGWTGSNGENPQTDLIIEQGSTGNKTFTANWSANTDTRYTVKYFMQNFDTEIENYEEDEDLREAKGGTTDQEAQIQSSDIKEIEGFTFIENSSKNKLSGIVRADGSLVLELYYRRNIYTIRYETNGGTMPSTTNRYYYGKRFVLSQNVRKGSNVFLGWYDNSELNGNAVTYVEAGETGDKTFYAKWGEANNLYVEAMNNQCVVEDNMISKIGPNTKLSDLSNKITTNGNVVVKNKKGVQIGNNDLIGTGYTITISMNGQEKTYEASILGDIDGNGKTSMVDIVKANQGMLGKINLTNAQKKAADTSGDNRLTLLDIVRMNQAYLGKISL